VFSYLIRIIPVACFYANRTSVAQDGIFELVISLSVVGPFNRSQRVMNP